MRVQLDIQNGEDAVNSLKKDLLETKTKHELEEELRDRLHQIREMEATLREKDHQVETSELI